jgi:hypothetical protein
VTGRAKEALEVGGLIAAFVLAAIVNVLGARHFTRWDVTRDRRWSLSDATVQTLDTLEQPVDVWAITGPGDPLEQGLRQLLESYRARASRIDVHFVDPERDAAILMDLERRFGLQAGRTEDGRIAADAVVIVASGDKHWFLTPRDMFEASDDDVHVKPREERALTQAIRNVLGSAKTRLCFTQGHGELSLEPGRDDREGFGNLRDLLEKDNYELAGVDTTAPGAHEPFKDCQVVFIAGAHAPFAPEEANRLRTWLLEGGSLFAVIGPIDASTPSGMAPAGLDAALSPFGIGLDDDLVHDLEPSASIPETHGEGFFVTPRAHAVTAALVPHGSDSHPPRVAMLFSRSLRHVASPGAAQPVDLLATSGSAFAKTSIADASNWPDVPPRAASDLSGPFVLAMASERAQAGAGAAHGSRVVVAGSRFLLADENWRQPRPVHGAAYFVDSALSWLAARPEVVDVPSKAEVAAGVRISEEGRTEVRNYVLFLMPLAAILLGAAVWAWRRSSENQPYAPPGVQEKVKSP